MRPKLGIALGLYWGGIAPAIDVITAISAQGAIGGLPALLNALTRYTRIPMRWMRDPRARAATMPAHALCKEANHATENRPRHSI